MTRVTIALLAVTGLLVLGVAPASAHSNHVTAGAQVSADDTVTIERLFILEEGYLVLHADDDGEPGRAIGHRALESGLQTDVPIEMDTEYWERQNGTTTIWAVLHRDANGNGAFDPGTDNQLSLLGRVAGTRLAVGKSAAGNTSVTAAGFSAQTIDGPSVTVRRVALAQPGSVVVSADDDGSPGAIAGQRALDAGVHENVTVELDPAFYRNSGEQFRLWATAHTNDGGGSAEVSAGPPVVVNGTPVGTVFPVQKSGDGDSGSLINTATATTARQTTAGPTTNVGTTGTAPPIASTGATSVEAATEKAGTAPSEPGARDDEASSTATEAGRTEPTSAERTIGTSDTNGAGFDVTMVTIALVIATIVFGARSRQG
jgi:hypothetical protein